MYRCVCVCVCVRKIARILKNVGGNVLIITDNEAAALTCTDFSLLVSLQDIKVMGAESSRLKYYFALFQFVLLI